MRRGYRQISVDRARLSSRVCSENEGMSLEPDTMTLFSEKRVAVLPRRIEFEELILGLGTGIGRKPAHSEI